MLDGDPPRPVARSARPDNPQPGPNYGLLTVHSPLFFRKIIEIERFALRAAILHECQNYLGEGGGEAGAIWEEARKIEGLFITVPLFSRPLPQL